MSVQEIVGLLAQSSADRSPPRKQIGRSHRSCSQSDRFVRAQAPTVAQQLPGLRCVPEAPDIDPAVVPPITHVGGVRRQHSHLIAVADETTCEIANERSGRIFFEARIRLGEKEDPQDGVLSYSMRSRTE